MIKSNKKPKLRLFRLRKMIHIDMKIKQKRNSMELKRPKKNMKNMKNMKKENKLKK